MKSFPSACALAPAFQFELPMKHSPSNQLVMLKKYRNLDEVV